MLDSSIPPEVSYLYFNIRLIPGWYFKSLLYLATINHSWMKEIEIRFPVQLKWLCFLYPYYRKTWTWNYLHKYTNKTKQNKNLVTENHQVDKPLIDIITVLSTNQLWAQLTWMFIVGLPASYLVLYKSLWLLPLLNTRDVIERAQIQFTSIYPFKKYNWPPAK